jgi:hypothetical protein
MVNPKIFEGIENLERVGALPYGQAVHPVPTMICDQLVEAKFLIKFQADYLIQPFFKILLVRDRLCYFSIYPFSLCVSSALTLQVGLTRLFIVRTS